MNERWLKFFPGDKHLSIDESTVPYFGKHGTKQHIHGKPIRFGYKIWSLCTRLGYLIYGEPYQGAKTGNTNPNLGVGGSVVTNLISKLPTAAHYSFYTDNFFTSLQLLDDVSQMGHDITGTLWANRTEGAPLKDIKEMKKTARGSFHQITDVSLNSTLVRYNDNNIVTIASTESGVQPIGKLGISASKLKMPHDGYIYVATSDYYRENNLFKVGSTVNLDERIRKLNTGRTADDSLYYCDTWEVSYNLVGSDTIRRALVFANVPCTLEPPDVERGGRSCLSVARSALSLALQALNGRLRSEITPHESCFSTNWCKCDWNFFAANHDKRSVDGVGDIIKCLARFAVKSLKEITPREFLRNSHLTLSARSNMAFWASAQGPVDSSAGKSNQSKNGDTK
ncbi:PiggyBac transposable element-derived protein 3 [Eumeta japonica]|uniref:PiggyBac transposable element-derived protein 3 n=1 Tax=Eumeta variegata TaxID=151549 RepID=A0A4C1V4K7_EUMVA|nr:PiggyBac transposable element-derived protein 3 [Eumeta japonica]